MQQCEVDGPPNALTHITPLENLGALARYQLEPVTGQRHQLRVHMAALGAPIHNDEFYPALQVREDGQYDKPLQLLAQALAFTDPLSGEARQFVSRLTLCA